MFQWTRLPFILKQDARKVIRDLLGVGASHIF
jgi:hypothetical protein